jgi:hypothetical protein
MGTRMVDGLDCFQGVSKRLFCFAGMSAQPNLVFLKCFIRVAPCVCQCQGSGLEVFNFVRVFGHLLQEAAGHVHGISH